MLQKPKYPNNSRVVSGTPTIFPDDVMWLEAFNVVKEISSNDNLPLEEIISQSLKKLAK